MKIWKEEQCHTQSFVECYKNNISLCNDSTLATSSILLLQITLHISPLISHQLESLSFVEMTFKIFRRKRRGDNQGYHKVNTRGSVTGFIHSETGSVVPESFIFKMTSSCSCSSYSQDCFLFSFFFIFLSFLLIFFL